MKFSHQYNKYDLSFTTDIIVKFKELNIGTHPALWDFTKEHTITNAKISY